MNAHEFRKQYLRRFKDTYTPLEGIFELTGRCNFNCKMCYVHTKSNDDFLKTEKSGEWWIAQIDAACERGMIFALLTGGECFLHPNFRQIYSHLRAKGVYTRINTNAFLLNENNVDFLKENPPFEIQITLYAADNTGYERVTGVPAFEHVVKNIARAREAGLNVRISLTPNSFAPGETERILEFLKELQVPYSINQAMFTAYDESNEQILSDNEVTTEEKIRYLRLQENAKYEPVPIEKLPLAGGGRTDELHGVKCTAGRVSFAISHDGCMMPCTVMYHQRVPMGDGVDFGTAWGKIIETSKNFLMPVECEGCPYIKACLACPVLRGGKVGNGHCDPSVCEMTRNLVSAGVKKLN